MLAKHRFPRPHKKSTSFTHVTEENLNKSSERAPGLLHLALKLSHKKVFRSYSHKPSCDSSLRHHSLTKGKHWDVRCAKDPLLLSPTGGTGKFKWC